MSINISMTNYVSISQAIELLNSCLTLDRGAVTRLVDCRVQCNERLADHPTVQVGSSKSGYVVGLLGIINGLFGVDEKGWGGICAVVADDGLIEKFVPTEPINLMEVKG